MYVYVSRGIESKIGIKRDKYDNEVRIFIDVGRLLRPLLVVENFHKLKQDKPTQYPFEQVRLCYVIIGHVRLDNRLNVYARLSYMVTCTGSL